MPTVIGFMACVGLAQDPGPLCDPWEPLSGTPPNRPDPSLHAPAPPAPTGPYDWGRGWGRQTPDHIRFRDSVYTCTPAHLLKLHISEYRMMSYIYAYLHTYVRTFVHISRPPILHLTRQQKLLKMQSKATARRFSELCFLPRCIGLSGWGPGWNGVATALNLILPYIVCREIDLLLSSLQACSRISASLVFAMRAWLPGTCYRNKLVKRTIAQAPHMSCSQVVTNRYNNLRVRDKATAL